VKRSPLNKSQDGDSLEISFHILRDLHIYRPPLDLIIGKLRKPQKQALLTNVEEIVVIRNKLQL
jgi:hypothetical protein